MKESISGKTNEQQSQEIFINKLDETQDWLKSENIPYVVLGSLALHTYIYQPIRFWRGENFGHLKFPDIDLIVPRDRLKAVEQYRQYLLEGSNPIQIELSSSQIIFDYKPYQEYSNLTHKKLFVPFKSALLEPINRPFYNSSLQTVQPETLFHTFVLCGGILRSKDRRKVKELGKYIRKLSNYDLKSEDDFKSIHLFIKDRRKLYPLDYKIMWFIQTQLPKLHPLLYYYMWDKIMTLSELYTKTNLRRVE